MSLDLLVASSIASLAILLLLSSARASQSYFLAIAGYQNRSMELISASQEIVSATDSPGMNLSVASAISEGIANERGLISRIGGISNLTSCGSSLNVCRFVTFSGSTYLLVVSYENPSES